MNVSRPGVHPSGFGVALLAFSLTRFLVASTVEAEVETFVFAVLIPLSTGLGLTICGVAIGVGAVSRVYAQSVWRWSVLGTVAMLLVLVSTMLNTILRGEQLDLLWDRSRILIANVLLGGAVLGAIVGDRTARSRRINERLVQYAERAMLVNRLLRHEILNNAAIVKGYSSTRDDELDDASEAIRESTEQIERTVEHVGEFAATTGEIAAVDVGESVETVLDGLSDDADVTISDEIPDDVLVRADDRLDLLVAELVENAVEHAGPDATVTLEVVSGPRTVDLVVRDDGPGLPEAAEKVLAARSLPEYDDPSFGYGLQMVRLLVEHYDGAIEAVSDGGTALTVTLQRTRERSTPAHALGVPIVGLVRAGVAALLAGVVMGLLMDEIAGIMPVVGALYGVESPIVGWVTHLFHSVVFGLLFAAGCTVAPLDEFASSPRGTATLGFCWGAILWLVAAGIIMPIWMMGVGLDAMVPNLSPIGLVSHVVWGVTLGVLYATLPDSDDFLPSVERLVKKRLPVEEAGSSGTSSDVD